MKGKVNGLCVMLMTVLPVIASAEGNKEEPKSSGPLAVVEAQSKSGGEAPVRPVNPFTGNTAALEEGARALALARQRRSIAEQELGEQRALADIAKVKRENAMATTSMVAVTPVAAQLPLRDDIRGIRQSDSAGPSHGVKASKVASARSVRGRAGGGIAPTLKVEPIPSFAGPVLIGVTEMGGRRYALFEHNGKSVTIPEGGHEAGISVGVIKGREVSVNGVPQTINVGTQEIANVMESNASATSPNGSIAGNRPGVVSRDMATLQLPTIPAQGALGGPQPLR